MVYIGAGLCFVTSTAVAMVSSTTGGGVDLHINHHATFTTVLISDCVSQARSHVRIRSTTTAVFKLSYNESG